jgi:hypothetical protein
MKIAYLLPLLLLAACADPGAQWLKVGATDEQASADASACRTQARAIANQMVGRDADRLDMMSAPPTLSGQSSNMVQSMQRDQLAETARKRETAEMTSCMRGKGYSAR